MNYKRFLGAASAVLLIVIVILILAPGAAAQATYKTLFKFTGSEGSDAHWAPTLDAAGNLYGVTCDGGAYGGGVVFKLTPNQDGGWAESALHQFTGGDDGTCPGGLIFDATGDLYGTTVGGGNGAGVVFELSPNSDGTWTESVLYAFTGGADGSNPNPPLIFDAQGDLYSTTMGGGISGNGVVWELTPNQGGGWTETALYSFKGGKDGFHPVTPLLFDAAGNLYGTTQWGGACTYCGVVFKLAPNSDGTWTESLLHKFSGGKDGSQGCAGMAFDTAGSLYGATMGGGAYPNNGVAFRLTPNPDGGWKEKVLHQFTGGKDGGGSMFGPAACGLTIDASGNLYGTRNTGGAYGYGVVYKLTPKPSGGWRETVLRAFKDHPGAYPDGGVTLNAAGNLYGTTTGDGSKTFGSVYQITP